MREHAKSTSRETTAVNTYAHLRMKGFAAGRRKLKIFSTVFWISLFCLVESPHPRGWMCTCACRPPDLWAEMRALLCISADTAASFVHRYSKEILLEDFCCKKE
ncbi:unnamed protein product [Ectocarpus sp. 12 AP-2014]